MKCGSLHPNSTNTSIVFLTSSSACSGLIFLHKFHSDRFVKVTFSIDAKKLPITLQTFAMLMVPSCTHHESSLQNLAEMSDCGSPYVQRCASHCRLFLAILSTHLQRHDQVFCPPALPARGWYIITNSEAFAQSIKKEDK